MANLITLANSVTHDETAGVQNDGTENDILTLPTGVDTILTGLGLNSSAAIGFASNIVLDIDSSVTGLRFTDTAGDDLNGTASLTFKTTEGATINLYTAGDDGDVLLGKLADGTVVFAVVMSAPDVDGNVTFTMIQWASLYHDDTTNHDETITLDDFVSVTAASDLEFSGFKAPPGNNEWLYFGTEAAETQIVVTAGVPGAETVNTSQTGLAIANQAINPGETIRISFVTGATGDTKDIDALAFATQVLTNSAGFKVSQVNPTNSTIDLKVALYDAPDFTGTGDQGDIAGGTSVGISGFVIYDASGNEVLNPAGQGIMVNIGAGTIENLPSYYTVRFTGDSDFDTFTVFNSLSTGRATFDISSVIFGSDEAETQTVGDYVAVEDDGPTASVLADGTEPGAAYLFDGNQTNGNFEGNNGTGAPTDDAARDGDPTSVTVAFAGAFSVSTTYGQDGAGSDSTAYSLVLAPSVGQVTFTDGNAATVSATSGGVAVDWYEVTAGSVYAGVLTGTTTEVFRLSVDGDGKVTFSQFGPLDHTRDDTTGPYSTDILTLANNQISVKATATATDSEGDTATADASIDLGGNFAVGDDGPKITVTADGTEPGTATLYDGNLTGGNFTVSPGDTSVEVDFSGAFSTNPAAGADGGSGSTTPSYALVLDASGQVQFKDNADATVGATSGGTKVEWSTVTAGSVYAGVLESTSTEVFRLAIDADGKVTFSQFGPLDHTRDDSAPDYTTDMLTLADNQISVKASATVTDSEGDSATDDATVDLGGNFAIGDDGPVDLTPDLIAVKNDGASNATAALGYIGKVGADVLGSVLFSGTDGSLLQGIIKDGSNEAPESLQSGGSPIYLFGFGTDTLVASTDSSFDVLGFDPNKPAASVVFYMTLDPDNGTLANDTYSITMLRSVDNLVEVDFGDFTAAPSSGNPLTLIVNNVGGSGIDALFSGFLDGPSSTDQTTVNVSGAGVGVGTGQDFDYDMSNDIADRIKIEFIEDNGNGSLQSGEERTVNNFTFIMNQNNSPADDGDALVRVYDESGTEVQITGVEINDTLLAINGTSTVPSNDGTFVTAAANGLGIILRGLGGGTAGSTTDNDSVTIITASGYHRIDITGIGEDANKDTFDILLGSVSVPLPYDVEFTTQAYLMDEDDDRSSTVDLDVVLDYDGVIA